MAYKGFYEGFFPHRFNIDNYGTPDSANVYCVALSPGHVEAHVWGLPDDVVSMQVNATIEDDTGLMSSFQVAATIHHSDGIQRGPRVCRVHDDCRALPALGNACAEVTNVWSDAIGIEVEPAPRRLRRDARAARAPRAPEELVGALQDRIHPTSGRLLAAKPIATTRRK